MLTYLKRYGGAIPRTVHKLRRGEKLFVQIRSRDAWEQDYRQHKWDQLVTKFTDAGNLALIGFMLSFALKKQKSRLLDVGCGNGALLQLLSALDIEFQYVGTDISQESLAQLKQRFADAETICTDMAATENVPGRYDVVVLNECLFYSDYDAVIEKYRSKIEPDGVMIVSMVHNAGRLFIWRSIGRKMNELMSFTVRNDQVKDSWTVKLLSYK